MTHHIWGDETFDWGSLNKTIDETTDTCRKWGRIGMHSKEKWGCFRDQLYPFDGNFHSITHPGYVYCQYPKWLWHLDCDYGRYITKWTGLGAVIRWWQRQVYNYAIQRACKRYPHIIDEIVSDLDGYEWVRPGVFGKVDGVEIHNKYWRDIE